MPKKHITILGINPGAKYLGLAVFRGPDLRDWRVRVTRGKWSTEKYRETITILSRFFERHSPDVIVVKRLDPSRSSVGLDRLVERIIALAEKKGLKVCRYGLKELEAFFHGEGPSNKRKMAEIIASQYPILYSELDQERRNKNPYYLRMFEAVGLAAVCFNDLDNSERSSRGFGRRQNISQ
jgi:Holliday junction resolvasome RuvABC endonuclease subunit